MVISVAVVILSIVVCRILSRHGIGLPRNVLIAVFALEAIGTAYSVYSELAFRTGFDGILHRDDIGGRGYEETLSVRLEGQEGEPHRVDVDVRARVPTEEEAFAYLDRAIAEIEDEFLGENVASDQVTDNIVIRDTYADGLVEASWVFDGHGIIAPDGSIRWERYTEPCEVTALCELSCGEHSTSYEVDLIVTEPSPDTEAGFNLGLHRALNETDIASRSDAAWELPTKIGGRDADWLRQKDRTGVEITLFGAAAGGALILAGREEEKRKAAARTRELSRDYPEIVSRLSLYVGAGFGLRTAFARIGEQYSAWKAGHGERARPGYEAIVSMNRKMADGMGEAEAYRLLGEDTAHKDYRKLSLMLRQNLRKGSRDMIERLEKEERIACDEKRTMAKIAGEEASTKLLLPMMLLLGVLLVVLIVPAWIGMGIA